MIMFRRALIAPTLVLSLAFALLRGRMSRADWLLFLLAILIVIRFAWVAAA